ncbi:tetratricopeptide repeat-containing protein [Nonomuraea sp. WAC 01424]|uniref:tetratricopeptide repeat protein n=1 Tax=Nonomuraea sp. WAC 01424 TaxID=2203200 RepID=UPI000F79588A|nr:tetratricopeptide repeat protein [Nonomuraea sp. WAC 01424]RSN06808.1 tetratricopeptide repeat-containing protein [Nonomuraea sp. WAC 01424]
MSTDEHGLAMTGASAAATRHYDRAIDELLHFRSEVDAETDAALADSPGFPMANVLAAYLGLLTTEAAEARTARDRFDAFRRQADESSLLPRERAHVAAVRTLLDGDLPACGALLAEITTAHPRDAVALAAGHQLDFFTGDARALRDRVGGALTAWHEDDPHFGHLLGMYAFGLEEAGHYDRSEEVGLRAVELNRRDVWGIHAVVHTYEMQGRFGEGVRYLDARLDDWSTGTFFNVHTWWHYALYALEAGDVERALAVHDAVLGGGRTSMELLDAAALLWRLLLEGSDQHERWQALADAWPPLVAEPFYAFNDMHAVMSYVGAGRIGEAETLIASREAYTLESRPGVANVAMTLRVGLPVCRALVAYGRGDFGTAVDLLYPIRHRVNEFGGSHAQRDAVQKTLLEAALRGGRHEVARVLVSERVSVRPCSPFNWLKHAALADRLGDHATAATARQKATTLIATA